MGKKRKKLQVDESTTPSSLNDAFSGLDLAGLPDGTDEIEPAIQTEPKELYQSGKRGEVILRRETAHRAGKAVIIVEGLAAIEAQDSIIDLATRLKKHCGCGGTVKESEIIIQGEKAPQVADFLREEGFRVRGITK